MEYFTATNKKPSSKRPVGADTFAPPPRAPHPDHLPQKLRAQPRSDAHLRSAAAAGRIDELRSLIARSGLDVGRSTRVLRRVPYLASPRALASGNEHDCVFFVARAPAIVRNRTWWGEVTSR